MNKRIFAFFIFLILLSAAVFAVHAQGTVVAESQVDRSQILIGDVITYTVLMTYDPGLEVQMPSPGVNLGQFEIRNYKVAEPQKKDGKLFESASYQISTFETGEYEIPALEISYRSKADTSWSIIRTQPLTIKVESLNPDEAGDIRDIKPPMTPSYNYRALIFWSVMGLLAIALVGALIYVVRRRRQGRSIFPHRVKPPRPAHEIALEELDELIAGDLLQTGQVKEYYSRLSEIIRRYIGNRFSIYALEMTSSQLLDSMRGENLPEDCVSLMNSFLIPCDLVKFAKFIPSDEEHSVTTEAAYRFVNDTKLVIVDETVPVENSPAAVENEAAEVIEEKKEEEVV
jgi:hypothetical protein